MTIVSGAFALQNVFVSLAFFAWQSNSLRMTPAQIREKGIKALAKALKSTGMVRFLQQFDMGSSDYTRDREEWLKGLTVRDVVEEIESRRKESR